MGGIWVRPRNITGATGFIAQKQGPKEFWYCFLSASLPYATCSNTHQCNDQSNGPLACHVEEERQQSWHGKNGSIKTVRCHSLQPGWNWHTKTKARYLCCVNSTGETNSATIGAEYGISKGDWNISKGDFSGSGWLTIWTATANDDESEGQSSTGGIIWTTTVDHELLLRHRFSSSNERYGVQSHIRNGACNFWWGVWQNAQIQKNYHSPEVSRGMDALICQLVWVASTGSWHSNHGHQYNFLHHQAGHSCWLTARRDIWQICVWVQAKQSRKGAHMLHRWWGQN